MERGDWRERLRERGYRLTPQRELVLAAVERLGHATPDEVLNAIREESAAVNVSTVYRTLELLEELGLVRHAHLVCRGCGSVTEVPVAELSGFTEELRATKGFAVDVGHLTVFGTCAYCH